jgi:hypothetical protein
MAGIDYTGKRGAGGEFQEQSTRWTEEKASAWPTPQAHDAQGGKTAKQIAAMRARTKAGVKNLNEVSELWQTPVEEVAKLSFWATPVANPEAPNTNSNQVNSPPSLGSQAELWMTPAATDHKGSNVPGDSRGQLSEQTEALWENFPSLHLDQPTLQPGEQSLPNTPTSRRRLNPKFVCWLMLMPHGWTSLASMPCASWEIWLFLHRRQLHSLLCGVV